MPEIHPTLPNDGETADAADVSIPLAAILALINGGLDADNIADLAITTGKLADNSITGAKLADGSIDLSTKGSQWDGWLAVTDTWAYASANTITTPAGGTNKYDIGDFISIVQSSTTKYFRVQNVTSTVLTVQGVAGAVVANSTISSPRYSKARNPHSMPSAGLDWWQEIGRTTLTVAGDTLSCTGLPARKYLKLLYHYNTSGGSVSPFLQFNGDTGANYCIRFANNGGGDTSQLSQNQLVAGIGSSAQYQQGEFFIANVTALEKIVTGQSDNDGGAGAANIPGRLEMSGKWSNTSAQINRVDLINTDGGDFAIGAELIVLGHD